MNKMAIIIASMHFSFGALAGLDADAAPSHLAGCILLEPLGDIPSNIYTVTDVAPAEGIQPFTKDLTAYGLRLVGQDKVSDDFMRLVGRTIAEIFPRDDRLDLAKQQEIIELHHLYRAFIPIPVDGDFGYQQDNPEQFEALTRDNSICDVIMQGNAPQGQVMEVLEHILHFVTDIGLHYGYPGAWGINADSSLAIAMQKAIEAGYYKAAKYDDEFEDREVAHRVKMQEFAYWFITTAWNLQAPYGPIEEDEWTIRNAAELSRKLPGMYAVFNDTVGRIMVPPSMEILEEIGPLRNKAH